MKHRKDITTTQPPALSSRFPCPLSRIDKGTVGIQGEEKQAQKFLSNKMVFLLENFSTGWEKTLPVCIPHAGWISPCNHEEHQPGENKCHWPEYSSFLQQLWILRFMAFISLDNVGINWQLPATCFIFKKALPTFLTLNGLHTKTHTYAWPLTPPLL